MASSSLPSEVDTVIIGNGPSALILSYLLHGNVPYYIGGHPDSLLDTKLADRTDLLHLTPDLYAHFHTSLRYSTQALPINTLLDTLIRPNADTEANSRSCLEWKHEPTRAVRHVVLGNASAPGGQWQDNPVSASASIGTLSYAEQLSLPGYSFADHFLALHGKLLPDFVRPSRRDVAEYLRQYANAVGISDSCHNSQDVSGIYRVGKGFYIGSHGITCRHLVLASGIFSQNVPPPPLLRPLVDDTNPQKPLLVVGSGFSAADVIISTESRREIVHVFKWSPTERPSPLKGCHHQAYPEYSGVYKQMKLAAANASKRLQLKKPMVRRKSSGWAFGNRDWATTYHGLPNAVIEEVNRVGDSFQIRFKLANGEVLDKEVGGLQYVVGRRGNLAYLDRDLRNEVLTGTDANLDSSVVSGRSLRAKVEIDPEVARDVHVIGSLAGDSLIRHALGTAVFAAGSIMDERRRCHMRTPFHPAKTRSTELPDRIVSNHAESPTGSETSDSTTQTRSSSSERATEHEDLHVDRRSLAQTVEMMKLENETWLASSWWGGVGRIT